MKDGFLNVACATPKIKVADCTYNTKNIINLILEAASKNTSLIAFPELCITGYTCQDLFFQSTLINSAKDSLFEIAEKTADKDIISIVGLPIKDGSALYNCAAVLYHGEILGLVPKKNLPNYSEYQEVRYFSKGCDYKLISINEKQIPMGTNILFACKNISEFKLGIELCEDLWVPIPPSSNLALCGATVIANLSASDEFIGKSSYRRDLVKGQSARLNLAYLYADAGMGESSTDLVFSGHNIISENGTVLSESAQFNVGIAYAQIDLQRIESERRKNNNFSAYKPINTVYFDLPMKDLEIYRSFCKHPFIPSVEKDLNTRCDEILTIQAKALEKRLTHIGSQSVVIGLSGGLDSTLALIVAVKAFDSLKLNRNGIIAVSMPGFGTSSKTKSNAYSLAMCYNVTFKEISIVDSINVHFKDINQDINDHNTTYENAQARERAQILMDIANQVNGIVVGTGDLSELALGFTTYNGDHMSMYSVNSSIPKTLVKHLINYEAKTNKDILSKTLLDIINTPISPELLPQIDEQIVQKTEEIIGPYELHDFFLYYFIRFGFSPKKILRIAKLAFVGIYDEQTIIKHLETFMTRFFASQFKRSCLPDGPKVGSVTLSPRGDFRMPSDADLSIWINELKS